MAITDRHGTERRKPLEQCNLETNEDRVQSANESSSCVDPTWCTAECGCLFIVDDPFFTHSEARERQHDDRRSAAGRYCLLGYLDVSFAVQQDVVKFQIARIDEGYGGVSGYFHSRTDR